MKAELGCSSERAGSVRVSFGRAGRRVTEQRRSA